MEKENLKKNLNELQIKDFEFYTGARAPYYNLLKKHNITTIGQLLNDDLMKPLILRCGEETRNNLNILIAMAKYEYLNIPLPGEALLDKKLIIDEKSFRLYVEVEDKLKKRFATEKFIPMFRNSAEILEKDFFVETGIYDKNTKLIDYFKWLSITDNIFKPKTLIVSRIVSIYIESYEKNKNMNNINNDVDTIESLRSLLANIIDVRDNLNNQISELQEKINLLSQTENKGGIKRWQIA